MALVSRQNLLLVFSVVLFSGCGDSGTTINPSWLGIPSTVKFVIEEVNAGTNWILNKDQVNVAKVGDVRSAESDSTFLADFQISVTNGTNSFETTAKDVPCDKDGIPTEESITKLREAVEEIKAKIKKLQN